MVLSILPTAKASFRWSQMATLRRNRLPTKAAKVLVSAAKRGRIHFFEEWIFMKKSKSKEVSAEVKCPACDGTGFPNVKQPVQPGRRIYTAPARNARSVAPCLPLVLQARSRTTVTIGAILHAFGVVYYRAQQPPTHQ
jgi:hypothetical protein